MSDIVRYFNDLDDPQTGNATRHLFPETMLIAFVCVLCGGETAVDMADFAEAKDDILRESPEWPFGTPGHDAFSRVFQALARCAAAGSPWSRSGACCAISRPVRP